MVIKSISLTNFIETNAGSIFIVFIIMVLVFILYKNFVVKAEGFGNFYTNQNAFTKGQTSLHWDKLNKELDYNTGLENEMKSHFKDAVKGIDPMTNITKKNNLDAYFRKDPIPGMKMKSLNCSSVDKPSLLPKRSVTAASGCGWVYNDDSNVKSFGETGTKLGALQDYSKKYPNAQWIWDLDLAQKKEDIKKCRRVKSCEVSDLLPGECGFCNITGAGLPITSSGEAKYPDDPTLVCPEKIITSPKTCPRPVPVAVKNTDGTISLQTPTATQVSVSICDPVNGRLSNECLKTLAAAVGFSSGGAIMSVLDNDIQGFYKGDVTQKYIFSKALEILMSDAKIKTDKAFLGDGVCTREDAIKYYKEVNKTISAGQTTRAKDVAGFLVLGTDFNPCEYDSDQKGPFDLFCLETLAREKGCQPDGTDYPKISLEPKVFIPPVCKEFGKPSTDGKTRLYSKDECNRLFGNYFSSGECLKAGGGSYSYECRNLNKIRGVDTKNKYDAMRWKDVHQYFKNLHDSLRSSKQEILEEATLKCLGVKVARSVSECGDKKGCEILWYSWDYEWDFPNNEISSQTFYGREVRPELPSFNTSGSDFNPYGIQNRVSFKIRTDIQSDITMPTRLWVMSDDGVSIKMDDKTILKQWNNQTPSSYQTEPVTLTSEKPNSLEVTWYNDSGGSTFTPKLMNINGGFETISPSLLTIKTPKTFPLSRWDFYNSLPTDRNKVLNSKATGRFGSLEGKKCLILSDLTGVSISNKIRGGAFLSYTFMTYNKGGWARLFALRKGDCPKSGPWKGYSIEGGISDDGQIWFAMQRDGGLIEMWLTTQPRLLPNNKWAHIGFSIDDDFRGATIYLNAKKVARQRLENFNGDNYRNLIFDKNSIGHINWSCNMPIVPPPSDMVDTKSLLPYRQGACISGSGVETKGTYRGNVQSPDACYNFAKSAGSTFFGLHYFGQCFTGNTNDWANFPKLDPSSCDTLGKDGMTQIYTMGQSMIPQCPPSDVGALNIGLAWVHFFDYTLNDDDMYMETQMGFTDSSVFSEDNSTGWKK